MSGIYSRLKYDQNDYQNLVNISKSVGNYSTTKDQLANNKLCIADIKPVNARVAFNSSSNISELVDVESNLKNIDVPLSNNIDIDTFDERYQAAKKIAKNLVHNDIECKDILHTVGTRFEVPTILTREATTSRFDYPLMPASVRFYNGFEGTSQVGNDRYGISTRLYAKDRFGCKKAIQTQ